MVRLLGRDCIVRVRGLVDGRTGTIYGRYAVFTFVTLVVTKVLGRLFSRSRFNPDGIRARFGNPDRGRAAVLADSPLVSQLGQAGLLLAVLPVRDRERLGLGNGCAWGDDVAELVAIVVGLVVELTDVGGYGVGDWWCGFVLGMSLFFGDGNGDRWSEGAFVVVMAFVIISAGDGRCSCSCYAYCKRSAL